MLTKQQLREFLSAGPRRVHFIGIGGSGMSGLAKLLLEQGHVVTGCDLHPNGETRGLRQLGARVQAGHSAAHITTDTELLVYSSAINGEHKEIQAAERANIPMVRRGQLLSALMTHHNNIAVAGTHGKTTTSAMLAHVLSRSDSPPTYCIGAHIPALKTNAQMGGGKYFVAEVDESDGTLLGYTPDYAVCLNIEPEHLDHYGTVDKLLDTFEAFFASTLQTVFYCADCSNCTRLSTKARAAFSFGLSAAADYTAVEIESTGFGSRFAVTCRGERIGRVELAIPGRQNIMNALATIAVADQLGVPFDKIAAALKTFTGAKRRFERKYEDEGILVVDDYAHHPTEIRATIAAARTLIANDAQRRFKRLIVAFQPHRFTRVRDLCREFATAFAGADKIYLADIYSAGEAPIEGITGRKIADAVAASGTCATAPEYGADLDELAARLFQEAKPGDLILTMGAGSIYKVADALCGKLIVRGPNLLSLRQPPGRIEADLRSLVSAGARLRRNEPLARHTTMRVGGPAELWIEPADERDLERTLQYCAVREIPVTVMGRGSNMVVRDGGIEGVVIHLGGEEFSRIKVDGQRIYARAGARLKKLVSVAQQHELGGLEFMGGIPGSLGGALRMNAGAMGRQTFEVVEWVRYISLTGTIYDSAAEQLPVTYRCCPVFANHIALGAILRGEKKPRAAIDAQLQTFNQRRWKQQPAQPSAGCVFKNPTEIPAGQLIDELGLKGTAVGGASVSEKHANFIVNKGGATAHDVLRLIAMIRERAQAERGIELDTEVMIVGKDI